MSYAPERSRDKKQYFMPSFWGSTADSLITSHWMAKDRKIQKEHEAFQMLVEYVLENTIRFTPENEEEEVKVQELMENIKKYDEWRTSSTPVDFITMKDSQSWVSRTEFKVHGMGTIQLAPEKVQFMRLTGLPPIRYIRGRVSLDALSGDVREYEQYVSYHCAGVRARIFECHNPGGSWEACIYDCFNGKERCPYLEGPVYTRNLTRMDSGLYHRLINIAHRNLRKHKARILKPLWDHISQHVQTDQIQELLGAMPGREAEDETGG